MRNEQLVPLLCLAYLLVVWVARSLLHWRWTGSFGWRPLGRGAPTAAWLAAGLFLVGGSLGCAGVWLQGQDRLEPLDVFEFAGARGLGLALYALGFAGTTACQLGMGRSWRIGVDPNERTSLVTGGAYRLVRHPIYTSVVATVLGLVLILPNALMFAALALLAAGIDVQVRQVEEPHLERLHGEAYRAWAARSGRYLPWFGRVRR